MGKSFKQSGNPFIKNKPKRKGKEAKIENIELTEMIDSPLKCCKDYERVPGTKEFSDGSCRPKKK